MRAGELRRTAAVLNGFRLLVPKALAQCCMSSDVDLSIALEFEKVLLKHWESGKTRLTP